MHPSLQAARTPQKPAVIMANSGQTISFQELETRSIQVSQLLRARGLAPGDHIAIFLENHPWFHIIAFGIRRKKRH